MTSEVSICNMALGRIRAAQISALTDATVEGNACTTFFEPSRDLVLSDFPWNFAGKTLALSKLTAVPDEWSFAYSYPADALKIRKVFVGKERHLTDPTAFEVGIAADGTKQIMTNLDLAWCKYTMKQTNPNHFDAHFVTSLSWYLASEIAIPVAGTSKGRVLADRSAKGYLSALKTAYAANAGEEDTGPIRDSELIRAHQ